MRRMIKHIVLITYVFYYSAVNSYESPIVLMANIDKEKTAIDSITEVLSPIDKMTVEHGKMAISHVAEHLSTNYVTKIPIDNLHNRPEIITMIKSRIAHTNHVLAKASRFSIEQCATLMDNSRDQGLDPTLSFFSELTDSIELKVEQYTHERKSEILKTGVSYTVGAITNVGLAVTTGVGQGIGLFSIPEKKTDITQSQIKDITEETIREITSKHLLLMSQDAILINNNLFLKELCNTGMPKPFYKITLDDHFIIVESKFANLSTVTLLTVLEGIIKKATISYDIEKDEQKKLIYKQTRENASVTKRLVTATNLFFITSEISDLDFMELIIDIITDAERNAEIYSRMAHELGEFLPITKRDFEKLAELIKQDLAIKQLQTEALFDKWNSYLALGGNAVRKTAENTLQGIGAFGETTFEVAGSLLNKGLDEAGNSLNIGVEKVSTIGVTAVTGLDNMVGAMTTRFYMVFIGIPIMLLIMYATYLVLRVAHLRMTRKTVIG